MTATVLTTATTTATDAATMLRRSLRHMIRYPGLTGFVVGMPVVFLLLFVYVFGGTLGAGLPGGDAAGGSGDAIQVYLTYVMPGILVISIAGTASGISISVAQDMTEGIVARFRSMAISRAAVLTGHVIGNTLQGVLCIAILLAVAVLLGLRPGASVGDWLVLTAFLAFVCLAVSWIAVAMGMSAASVETASNLPMIFILLPFLGSGFVPTESMPGWMQGFAQWQPFTAFIETTRSLLGGSWPGSQGWQAIGWCIALIVVGHVWASRLYERKSVR
jgi:ABC-2 type transport system permease protein